MPILIDLHKFRFKQLLSPKWRKFRLLKWKKKKKKKKLKYLVVSFTLRFFMVFQASNKTLRLHLFYKIKHCRPQSMNRSLHKQRYKTWTNVVTQVITLTLYMIDNISVIWQVTTTMFVWLCIGYDLSTNIFYNFKRWNGWLID